MHYMYDDVADLRCSGPSSDTSETKPPAKRIFESRESESLVEQSERRERDVKLAIGFMYYLNVEGKRYDKIALKITWKTTHDVYTHENDWNYHENCWWARTSVTVSISRLRDIDFNPVGRSRDLIDACPMADWYKIAHNCSDDVEWSQGDCA